MLQKLSVTRLQAGRPGFNAQLGHNFFSVILLPPNWSSCSSTLMFHMYVLRGSLPGGTVIKAAAA